LLNTISLTFRTSGIFRQPALHDSLFLIVISILSFSNYISGLGFYEDDWYLLAIMNLSPDQSVAGVFTAIASNDDVVRPVYFFIFAISYKLFGLNPLPYQLLNGIFFSIGFVLLHFIVVALRQPRALSLSICLLYMLLPNYSSDRFWIAAGFGSNISMSLSFLGIYAHLQALRRQKPGSWAWEAFAILCVIVSGLIYELFLPLVLATAAFLFVSELATDWPASVSARTIAKAALRQGAIVLAVALVIFIKALWAPRAGKVELVNPVWIAEYVRYVGAAVVKAFVYNYGYHLLELPSTAWHALRNYADSTTVITASFIGIVILVRLHTSWDRPSAAAITSRVKMLLYLSCGIILFIAGYSLYPDNPAKNGVNNRTAIAGTLGVALSVVGLLGLLTSLAPGIWRKVLFSTVVAFIGMSGALVVDVLGKFWVQSYHLQNEFLSDIHTHIPAIPAGTTLMLDGVCPYNGPAPVFDEPWDLAFALSIYYGHAGIEANIVTRGLTVGPNGLTAPSGMGPTVYPFGQLYVYHFGRKASYALPDAQAAQSYFDNISADRASRCPADFYGNGVEVLGDFIPMLGRDPASANAAPRS
jgi:hypothetical protein